MANRHSSFDLKQMQSVPLEGKIIMTQERIRQWYDHWDGNVYVSFSGGKDSTVLKHIVDGMYDDVPAVFVNTGLEYPEIQQFVREIKAGKYDCFNSDVEIIRPEMRFDEVIKTYGYPVISKEVSKKIYEGRRATANGNPNNYAVRQFEGRYISKNGKFNASNLEKWKSLYDSKIPISDRCCHVMKKTPAKKYEKESGRKPIIGTMACESFLRKQQWEKNGCNAFQTKRPISQPMSFWTEQDVLHYIKKFNVPYCPVYGEIRVKQTDELESQINAIDYLGDYEPEDTLETTGCKRTGCMFCAFGITQDGCPNRFQRMKQTHPKQYAYCMEQLGLRDVLKFLNIPYE